MLERWMANDPTILGSDTDVLKAIADGRCDVGLTNSYYLGRELADDPGFPVAPVWADQDGRGTHVNLSGHRGGKASDDRAEAQRAGRVPDRARRAAAPSPSNNHEFAVDPGVDAAPEIAHFGTFKRDPIDVPGRAHLEDAVRMMNDVGWD